jgi:hypothetical protein
MYTQVRADAVAKGGADPRKSRLDGEVFNPDHHV